MIALLLLVATLILWVGRAEFSEMLASLMARLGGGR
jgi:hypothetical protein